MPERLFHRRGFSRNVYVVDVRRCVVGAHRPWQTPHAPSPPSCRSQRARTTARTLHSVIHRASVCFHARASIPITLVSLFVVSLYLCIAVSLYLVVLLYRCVVVSRCPVVSLCCCISLPCCIVVSLYLVALLYRCFVASHRLVVSLCRCITSDRHDCGLPRDLRRASGAGRLLCCRLGGIFGLGDGIRVRVHGKLILRRATRHLVALVWVAHLETLV